MPHWSEYHLTGNLTYFVREYVVTTILVILILVAVSVAMASDINVVAATIKVFEAAIICVPLVSPRIGMHLLILAGGYLDLIKRLMVITGQVASSDVAWVLGVAPAMFAAVAAGVMIHRIFKHRLFERGESWTVAMILVLMAANFAIIHRDSSSVTQSLQWAANTVGYMPLLLLTGILFPTVDRIKQFLRYISLALLPIPLYAVWQYFFGLTSFEYNYLRSGLTITEGYLEDVRMRAFSTLASAHPLTIVCAMLFLLSLMPVRFTRASWFPFTNGRWVLIAVTFLCGSFASLSRTGWVAAGLGLTAVGCFWSPKLTKIFYSVSIGCFFVLVLNADWIEDHIGEMQEMLPAESGAGEMAFRLGTIGDRLHGWKNIVSHPLAFGPFGIPLADRTEEVYVHDQIGEIMVNAGYVGLLAVLSLLTFAIVKAHQLTWKLRDLEARHIAIFCLATIFAVIASGAMFGGNTGVFPVNILFWLSGGILFQVFRLEWIQTRTTDKTPRTMEERFQEQMASSPVGRRIAGMQSPAKVQRR